MTLLARLADRYCSHRATNPLRPFDEGDWAAFNGCESEAPEIHTREDGACFVLDGNAVCVNLPALDEEELADGWQDIFADEFADEDEARAVILFLIENPGMTPKVLGESVGSC